jgi:hypothetical protein
MELHLKNKIIPIVIADTYNKRLRGLIGEKNIKFGMLFINCNAIHTYFMKEEIDVIGLNENYEIIFIKRNVKRNKMIILHRNIKKTSILELPKNTSLELQLGDKINLKSNQ